MKQLDVIVRIIKDIATKQVNEKNPKFCLSFTKVVLFHPGLILKYIQDALIFKTQFYELLIHV